MAKVKWKWSCVSMALLLACAISSSMGCRGALTPGGIAAGVLSGVIVEGIRSPQYQIPGPCMPTPLQPYYRQP
jgi:hypothetical protein